MSWMVADVSRPRIISWARTRDLEFIRSCGDENKHHVAAVSERTPRMMHLRVGGAAGEPVTGNDFSLYSL